MSASDGSNRSSPSSTMTRSRSSSPATDFSLALFDEYVRLGVRDVVVSPGSRSQALALVAAEYERRGLLRLRVRIDERVGGFLALGLAVETASPVLIITTSGTAVANLHPAVLEAHHSGVPLIVLSAVPIALVANTSRITVTGILHELIGSKAAHVVFHDLAGLLMMPLALGLLVAELGILDRLLIAPDPAADFGTLDTHRSYAPLDV